MRTVYATQLELRPKDSRSAADIFEDACARVRRWVEGKYQRAWKTSVCLPVDGQTLAPLQGHTLRGTSRAADGAQLFTFEWEHPAGDDSSTSWVTNCIVARDDGHVQIAVLLRVSTTRVVLRPVRFDLGRPRLIDDVLDSYHTSIDGWAMPTRVEQLTSAMVRPYVEDVLLNSNRNLPVIVLSPDVWHGGYADRPDALFERVKGFAHVTLLSDKWAAFTLTDTVEKHLSCYDGAVRLYWPGFRLEDNPFQHKLFLPQSIRYHKAQGLLLRDFLFRTLAAVASFRHTEGLVIRNARQTIGDLERRKTEELRGQVKAGAVEKNNLENELLEALEQIDQLTNERDTLKADLDAQRAAWAEVQEAMVSGQAEDSEPSSEQTPGLTTVLEAVEKARNDFAGSIIFLESAVRSARESPYKNPDRVYELFEALALVAGQWRDRDGNLGRSWEDALEELGFEYKDKISQTSKTKFLTQYTFNYSGKQLVFEQHVTIGAKQADKCLSVHLYRDDANRVLVIGHCGKHLKNTRS